MAEFAQVYTKSGEEYVPVDFYVNIASIAYLGQVVDDEYVEAFVRDLKYDVHGLRDLELERTRHCGSDGYITKDGIDIRGKVSAKCETKVLVSKEILKYVVC